MTYKLKLGLVISSYEIYLWQFRVLKEVLDSELCEISLLIIDKNGQKEKANQKTSLFVRIHEKMDFIYYRTKFDYCDRRNILSLLYDVKIIAYNRADNFSTTETSDENLSRILSYKLDLILNFNEIIRNNFLNGLSRYGNLSYVIGDNRSSFGFNGGYWEVVKEQPETCANVLLGTSDFNIDTVVYRTGLITYPNSLNVNRQQLYSLAPLIILRIIKGLITEGNVFLERAAGKSNLQLEISAGKIKQLPGNFDAAMNLLKVFFRAFFKKYRPLNKGKWSLIFSPNPNRYPLKIVLHEFKELKAPEGLFWADPFIVSDNNYHYIFIEEYSIKNDKGHISVLKLDSRGNFLNSQKIIEKQYHMSYPFVLKFGGKYYMIPETKGNNTIEIYECVDFPNGWKFVMNLMENVSATDTSLFFYENKWWLFTSINESKNSKIYFNELFLFYSDDLLSGNWISHPCNPVVTGIKSSRPAGKIYTFNDKIFRPSQDCTGRYGRALNINQITKLSETDYEEVLILYVKPSWSKDIEGLHTFNFNEKAFVLDIFNKKD